MLKTVKNDLEAVSDSLEQIQANLPRLTREEKVDLAARLRGVAKTAEAIDKLIKDDVKLWRKDKPGIVFGDIFKAVLALVPTTRLNQKKLKEKEPKIYAKYLETDDVARVTFEPR